MNKMTRRALARGGAVGLGKRAGDACDCANRQASLAHGDVLAEAAAGARHVGRTRRRAHRHAVRRTARDHRLGGGRSGAGFRSARRGRQRRRRDGTHGGVLLAGQGAGDGLLHHRAVRADAERACRLDRCRRRPGAMGRALRAVRRQAVHGRQYRRLHGRLVSPRDQGAATICAASKSARSGWAAKSIAGSAPCRRPRRPAKSWWRCNPA